MSKPSSKGKGKAHSPHLDELDDVEALFFLGEEEARPPESFRQARSTAPPPPIPAPKVVALVSRKGGTGKTSIAMNLAALLSTRQRRVLVLDLDRGADASRWFERGKELPFAVKRVSLRVAESGLSRMIGELGSEADLVIVDTPPANTSAMRQAVEAADLVLIPTGPSALDLEATVDAVRESLQSLGSQVAESPRVAVVPSRLISGTRMARELPRRLKKLSLPVAPSIGQRVEVAAAGSEGRAVRSRSQAGLEFSKLARFILHNLRAP
jgi:chromosome partitioning protein